MNTHKCSSDFLVHQNHLKYFACMEEGHVFLLILVYKTMRLILTLMHIYHHSWPILTIFKK